MVDRKVEQLKKCPSLADMGYGHIHPLRGNLSGFYSVRVNQFARLVIIPIIEDAEIRILRGKKFLKKITKILIFYSRDHYRSYMKKKGSTKKIWRLITYW